LAYTAALNLQVTLDAARSATGAPDAKQAVKMAIVTAVNLEIVFGKVADIRGRIGKILICSNHQPIVRLPNWPALISRQSDWAALRPDRGSSRRKK
jgi:hypothetical protein